MKEARFEVLLADVPLFKDNLTSLECKELAYEEEKITKMRIDLVKKYNKIVSDRVSNAALIAEVKRAIAACNPALKETLLHVLKTSCDSYVEGELTLESMDNKSLQTLLLVLTIKDREIKE